VTETGLVIAAALLDVELCVGVGDDDVCVVGGLIETMVVVLVKEGLICVCACAGVDGDAVRGRGRGAGGSVEDEVGVGVAAGAELELALSFAADNGGVSAFRFLFDLELLSFDLGRALYAW
jgi:hypothetical protein